jgi:hypothetical protein
MATKTAEEYLEALAAELAISDERYEQALRSYGSVGDWLHRSESSVLVYDPQVYVQGSFRLGTAIRPLNDVEEYDVDSVCVLRAATTRHFTQAQLKDRVGAEIKAYRLARSMVKPVREGRRCWILDYAEGAQFHMDIVPAVPNALGHRALLAAHGFSSRWSETAIAITDRESHFYRELSDNWHRSNPKGYADWFRERMGPAFERGRRILADKIRASVEQIPEYRVRTPLQSAIMILKRHRDGMFADRGDERPISIILTTLAAHAYNGEETVSGALASILGRMAEFIENDGQRLVIRNPTDPLENFADKWPAHPERQQAFFEWLASARLDFDDLAAQLDKRRIVEIMRPRLGTAASRAADRLGAPPNTLLRPAAAVAQAATVSAPTFRNERRAPTTPKGFA